jgi:hypothetical protein
MRFEQATIDGGSMTLARVWAPEEQNRPASLATAAGLLGDLQREEAADERLKSIKIWHGIGSAIRTKLACFVPLC